MIIGLIFFLLSTVALTFVTIKILLAIESKNWPSTDGEIIESFIFTGTEHDFRKVYKPKITYKYHVNGTEYVSENLDFLGKWLRSKKKAQSVTELYSVEKKVTVYYQESNPKVAVLEPKLKYEQILCLIACFALLVPSLIVMLK